MNPLSAEKAIGIIPARYASVRFPGKMLANIAGKSLIQRTYENSRRAKILKKLIVATDDERIRDHVESFGGLCVMSSRDCSSGSDRLAEVVRKYPEFADFQIVVNIQGDEPLLDPEIIDRAARFLMDNRSFNVATAATRFSSHKDIADPSNVKCVTDLQGNALYFSRFPVPFRAKNCCKHLGLYCYRKDFLLSYAQMAPTPLQTSEDLEQLKILENGYKIRVLLTAKDSIGVDTPEDIIKIESTL